MARSVAVIKQTMIDTKNATPALNGLDSPSKTSIWDNLFYCIALCINMFEQIQDLFKADLEIIAARAVPGTASWIQQQVLKFQYSVVNPQIIQLINFAPAYAVVDAALRIVTRASVKQDGRKVIIKVAKGVFPSLTFLSGSELGALKSYVDRITFAGVQIDVVSLAADRLKVAATIYYDGQYVDTVVKANVITAINNYFANLPFDGVVQLRKLVDAIQAVAGVLDVVLTEVKARDAAISITSMDVTNMVIGSTELARSYETKAGYIIGEDTGGYTLDDTISMVLGL